MELPHIGKNCALKECNRLDFLPIKCSACSQVFCLSHYQFKNHNCYKADQLDIQVPVCPLCMKPVVARHRDQLPDIAVSEHMDQYCTENQQLKTRLQQKSNLQVCSHRACKQKDLIYLECNECQAKFCIKHRHPTDHSCPGPKSTFLSANLQQNWNSIKDSCSSNASSSFAMIKNKAQQLTKSGQETLNRIASSSSSSGTNSRPNAQQVRRLQGELSQQEALALALQESARIANGGSQLEEEDAALARALHDSEMEARRGRAGAPQKDTCFLS